VGLWLKGGRERERESEREIRPSANTGLCWGYVIKDRGWSSRRGDVVIDVSLDGKVEFFLSTLEATQGQILSQSPTDASRFWWHLYGS